MKRSRIAAAAFTLILIVLAVGSPALAVYDIIDINNPFLRKIPLAVSRFAVGSPTASVKHLDEQIPLQLTDLLTFTGYFTALNPLFHPIDPAAGPPVSTDTVDFGRWGGVGADMLITGLLKVTGGRIEMELRLFDVVKKQFLLGKRYRGDQRDIRLILRRFASEVIFLLTGNKGLFDSRIAFVSTQTGNKEIYACDFDGKNIEKITKTGSITLSPAWSTDGRWMAFTSYQDGKADLYIRHMSKSQGAHVKKKGINITPAWRPKKFELAASLSYQGNSEIYLLTGTGKIIKRLTYNQGIDVSPAWSPDGRRIAFVSDRSGNPQIHVMDVSTRRAERLTFEGKYNTSPSWSPKGDKIAYSAQDKGRFYIEIIDAAGGKPVRLTDGTADAESPSWSPDGSLIAYVSNREGASRIYVMTAFGTDQRRLIVSGGEQSSPRWSSGQLEF